MEEEKTMFDLNNLLLEEGLEEGEDFNPFADNAENEEENIEINEEKKDFEEESDKSKKKKTIAEEENPENVGNEEEEEEGANSKNNGASPKNIYSSIAKVIKEEGTFPDLDFESITDSDSFIAEIQNQIKESIDEEYRRIDSALNIGVKPSVINSYRNSIDYLNRVTEDDIRDENNEDLRRNLILQDMINRGYSKERAEKTYQKSLDRGDDDVEDALDALEANKEYFTTQYEKLLNDANEAEKATIEEQKQKVQAFKKSIMEDKNLYGDFEVNKQMRQSIYDSLTKPIYTDRKTGETFTAVQKWEHDNPDIFHKAVGLIYHLTNGGKDFENLIKGEVKKKVSKARSEFENAIRNTSTNNGKLRLANAHDTDSESYMKGFTLDV